MRITNKIKKILIVIGIMIIVLLITLDTIYNKKKK